ncbi:hypothetical protein AB1Y20_010010 [Prymnesium parvum]|uniref:Mitochondrial carrier protein n=1 Tax=Prymnesium parvum TaxID=97485 RepID=A0AB34K2T0_PRYPA
MPAAAAAPAGKGWKNIRNGAILQCAEAMTLGMPLEVWKTRMGRYRNEGTMESFYNIQKQGISTFWKGLGPKLFESASKGAVLIYSKEAISESCVAFGMGSVTAGFVAGAGGGVAQTVVMGPCTFLVTAVVTGDGKATVASTITKTWKEKGVVGFYPGGVAIAFRQATNWASRQGFTDAVRGQFRYLFHGDSNAKLSVPQEALAGMCGGILSCWNHPFEVARIEMQARAAAGESSMSMIAVFRSVYSEYGMRGLFQGLIPRMGLNIWQTLFMVSGAKLIKDRLD